jgi:replicative DNA helicase
VSVAEFPSSAPSEFERTPPQDIAAEQCVLGGMMLSKDAIADVVETLRSADFYRPAHQVVYDAVTDLYGRGEPADAVTVAAELTKRGEIGRVGGAPYLHTLISSVPTAANAGYYARIVRERAILRRLVEAGTRITQMGYGGDGEVDDIVDAAQAEVYAVTDRRTSEDYLPLSEIMEGALDEIEAIGSRGGALVGVPTGFADLDQLSNGFHPGQMIIVAARPAIGKALALDTPLPTPTGWTTMGEVQVGDEVIGADGRPTRVVAATDVLAERPCFRVEFSDGSAIVADADHQWLTRVSPGPARAVTDRCTGDRHERGLVAVWRTEEIAATLRCPTTERRLSHRVANAAPLDLPERELVLPPYALGAWLAAGDPGSARLRGADPQVVMYVEAEGLYVVPHGAGHTMRLPGSAQAGLPVLGVFRDKHIPMAYLRSGLRQRRALLAGILDAAGVVTATGSIQFTTTNERLAADFAELVVSLGYHCSVRRRLHGPAATSQTSHTVTFAPRDDVFRLQTKRLMHKERLSRRLRCEEARTVTAVHRVPSVPVRCIQVANDSQLYLAGRSMIPTHNSTLGLDFARSAAIRHNLTSVIFSLEMGRNEITMRLLSAEARVALHTMRSGTMTDEDWTRLARRMGEVSSAPLFIDDLQLMQSGKRVESRQQEVSEFSRSLKLLAKELDVPVVAISQLNRGPEQRTDKRPLLSDLRESGCMTEDTALLRADTGVPVTFRELLDKGHEGVLVWSLDENRRLVAAPVTNVFASGVKPVYLLRLASGRKVKATGNHPFLTLDGWSPLDRLQVGDRIAIPRRTPEPLASGIGWSDHRLGLLAHLMGDGCVLRKQPVHYTSNDEANLAFVEAAAAAEFGITPRRVAQRSWYHTYLPAPYHCTNPLYSWFRELGIEDRKRIPDVLHSASNAEIAVFLRHLWATDGNVTMPRLGGTTAPRVYYATSSPALADGVALLLSRFGIVARVREVAKTGYRAGYHVTVADAAGLRRFCREIGVHGRRGETAKRLLDAIENRSLPPGVWNRARLTERQFQATIGTRYCGTTLYKSSPTRERLLRSETLREMASSDVFWDRVVAIEALGEQPVYDATVKGTHNFIADGIVAHNSLEQDSDMVILLHREDAYERESPRAGEADLIVAKHRNGPTATVTVAFQGHYSRFVDMAHG